MRGRREFLRDAVGALAALVVLPVPGLRAGPRVVGGAGEVAPGDVVRVVWPRALDAGRASVIHAVDGRIRTTTAAPPPTGLFLQFLEIAAVPADGRLGPGVHEFSLEVDGRRVVLGWFRVSPYRFGL